MTEDDIKKPGSTAAVFSCAGELVACTRKWAQRSARVMGPAETNAIERVLGCIAQIVVGPADFPGQHEKAQTLIELARHMEQYERGAYQQNGERAITNAAEQLEQAVKQPELMWAAPSDVAAILREHKISVYKSLGGGVSLKDSNGDVVATAFNTPQELCDWVRSPEGRLVLDRITPLVTLP